MDAIGGTIHRIVGTRLGIRGSGLGCRDSGFGTRDSGLGIRDSGSGQKPSLHPTAKNKQIAPNHSPLAIVYRAPTYIFRPKTGPQVSELSKYWPKGSSLPKIGFSCFLL